MNNIPMHDQPSNLAQLSTNTTEHHKSEIRFWQGVALTLAVFVLSLLASLILGLAGLLLSH